MVEIKLVPPDGGYGWVIAFAYSLHHFIVIPILQGFGLIFKDTFKDLGFSTTDISLIIVTNSAFAMCIGIILGPLLKQLGYRKVAIFGAMLSTVGMITTAYASKLFHFIITYGIIAAAGRGIGMTSYAIALNTYFLKNRCRAAGYVMTIWGIGPIIMPQIYNFLLQSYGVKGAVIITSAITGHTFVSSLLLHPVKWHMKEEIVADEVEAEKLLNTGSINKDAKSSNRQENSAMSRELSIEALYGMDISLDGSILSLHKAISERSMSISSKKSLRVPDDISKMTNSITLLPIQETANNCKKSDLNNKSCDHSTEKINDLNANKIEERSESLLKQIGKRVIDIFDLTLLTDATYVNIALGLAFAFFSEQNFSLLTPFILQDYGLNTQEIATFMSVVSILDICFRFIAPYIGGFMKFSNRNIYLIALIFPTIFRSSVLLAEGYVSLLCCAVFIGIGRGFQLVYYQLVLPSHVPIERLASAIGLYSTITSVCICIGGPFLGFIRDVTGSFAGCIIVINIVTVMTIVTWSVEILYKRYRYKRKTVEIENK